MFNMIEDVQYKQGCAVQIRHIFSRSEDVQCKQVDHQVLVLGGGGGGALLKIFSIESLILLIYQVKSVSSLWQTVKIN